MGTSKSYMEYILDKINDVGAVRCKKMFGEYMVYINDKPILLICDNTVFVKKLDAIKDKMLNAKSASPYEGAREHYILDIEDIDTVKDIICILEKVTPVPKKKNKKD